MFDFMNAFIKYIQLILHNSFTFVFVESDKTRVTLRYLRLQVI